MRVREHVDREIPWRRYLGLCRKREGQHPCLHQSGKKQEKSGPPGITPVAPALPKKAVEAMIKTNRTSAKIQDDFPLSMKRLSLRDERLDQGLVFIYAINAKSVLPKWVCSVSWKSGQQKVSSFCQFLTPRCR